MPKPLPDRAYLRDCFIYAPATGDLVWKARPASHFKVTPGTHQGRTAVRRWNGRLAGKVAGIVSSTGHIHVTLNNTYYLAHRIIWKLMTGKEVPLIDHIDGNPGNNRWDNLRAVTPNQSVWNTRGKKSRTLPKGVFSAGRRWVAYVRANHVRHYLGTFDTVEEAKSAYDAAVHRLHGEFANTGDHQ